MIGFAARREAGANDEANAVLMDQAIGGSHRPRCFVLVVIDNDTALISLAADLESAFLVDLVCDNSCAGIESQPLGAAWTYLRRDHANLERFRA